MAVRDAKALDGLPQGARAFVPKKRRAKSEATFHLFRCSTLSKADADEMTIAQAREQIDALCGWCARYAVGGRPLESVGTTND